MTEETFEAFRASNTGVKPFNNEIAITCRNGYTIENPIIEGNVISVECYPNKKNLKKHQE